MNSFGTHLSELVIFVTGTLGFNLKVYRVFSIDFILKNLASHSAMINNLLLCTMTLASAQVRPTSKLGAFR